MSELKARWIPTRSGNSLHCYIKSEADKYINLLKDKANYNEYAYKRKSEELADSCRFYEDEIRHQKYTRCLDNAWWCRKLRNVYALIAYTHRGWKIAGYYDDKAELYRKWNTRWLKIAEQFICQMVKDGILETDFTTNRKK